MKTYTKSDKHTRYTLVKLVIGIMLILAPMSLIGHDTSSLIDDFSDAQNNILGFPRMIIDDTTVGGKSTSKQTISNGVLTSMGNITPPRGQPGWVSMAFLLKADGSPADISQYEGIRMKIKIRKGMMSVSVNSTDVVNFDFHAAMIKAGRDGRTEVRIPFTSMRRAWSEQTKLNLGSIASISLVSVGIQAGDFAFEIDEIGFY